MRPILPAQVSGCVAPAGCGTLLTSQVCGDRSAMFVISSPAPGPGWAHHPCPGLRLEPLRAFLPTSSYLAFTGPEMLGRMTDWSPPVPK